jgi:predicted transglutaminase-like cysteine proteinase
MVAWKNLAALIIVSCGLAGCQSLDAQSIPSGPRAFAPLLEHTAPPRASTLPAGFGAAADPGGFLGFCMRRPDQCQENSGAIVAELTPANWDRLQQINYDVNRKIAPQTDLSHYGRQEYWTIPSDGRGDCEDYALAKREELAAAGLPMGALRIAIVLTGHDTRHAVLTVATDHGDYVLDNLSTDVLAASASRYRWIERQDAAAPWRWVSLLDDEERRRLAALGEDLLTGSTE